MVHLNDVATQAMVKAQEDNLSQRILEDLILRAGLYPYSYGQVRCLGWRWSQGSRAAHLHLHLHLLCYTHRASITSPCVLCCVPFL
jgi:hypothetical protein